MASSMPNLLSAAPERIPNARFGSEVPISHTNILGSSQLTGCQGDFCNFNLLDWQPNYKQRRIVSAGGDYQKDLLESGIIDPPNGPNQPGLLKWNYNSILLARQQAPLVKNFLERHFRGENIPLAIQDNYMDVAVAGKLPARYYQEVPVCSNCYKIYNIIDQARARSIRPVSKERPPTNGALGFENAKDYLENNLTSFQASQLASMGGRRRLGSSDQVNKTGNIKHKEEMDDSLRAAYEAIEGLTKLDVAEIRTMVKPPAAVEVVIEAVMILLTGKYMTFKEAYRLLGGGEAFLAMLKEFDIADVTDKRLQMIELYVDNPLFRPENVLPVSFCASKFCAWVHGIVHAARHQRGQIHHRIDNMRPPTQQQQPNKNETMGAPPPSTAATTPAKSFLKPLRRPVSSSREESKGRIGSAQEELSFVQKLEKMKARRASSPNRNLISRESSMSRKFLSGKKPLPSLTGRVSTAEEQSAVFDRSLVSAKTQLENSQRVGPSRMGTKFDPPGPTPSLADLSVTTQSETMAGTKRKIDKREAKAIKAMQAKSIERLAAQTAIEGSVGVVGSSKVFVCADGVTRLPYVVMGKFSPTVEKCNFVVIHDFFDTYDATAILFKQLVQRHNEGCQVLCFNYPGQAHTTWPRLSSTEREHGGKDLVLSNDWLADRLHELLRHAEQDGDILMARPFHLVGMGLGASIAASFIQRYAYHDLYVNSLRSFVSINGFLYPDAQLSSILHAAYQVFESTPHTRPDIAVSYWSRFLFSEDYLSKVNPNLALNIYTAVSNPITNDGRVKLVRGCLASKDLRGSLAPDSNYKPLPSANGPAANPSRFQPIQVPVVVLQSTEDGLIHPANVDAFLLGRSSKHLWSHMLNVPSEEQLARVFDVTAQWVGRMSSSPEDYVSFSTLGRSGLRMLLDSLRNPRGAFVMWTRSGHVVQQEYKAAFLDLMDALACPDEDYYGLNVEAEIVPDPFTTAHLEPELPLARTASSPNKNKRADEIVDFDSSTAIPPVSPGQPVAVSDDDDRMEEDDYKSTSEEKINLDEAIDEILRSVKLPVVSVQPQPNLSTSLEEEGEGEGDDVQSELGELVAEEKKEGKVDKLLAPPPPLVINTEDVLEQSLPSLSDLPVTPAAIAMARQGEVQAPTPPQDIEKKYISSPAAREELAKYWKDADLQSKEVNKSNVTSPTRPAEFISNTTQRSKQQWVTNIPDASTAMALETELRQKQQEYFELEEKLKKLRAAEAESQQQVAQVEPNALQQLAEEITQRQKEREFSELQRRVNVQELEEKLEKEGILPPVEVDVIAPPLKEMRPMHYTEPADLPKALLEGKDMISKLDQMVEDETEARRRGILSVHEFEKVKKQMAERQLERDQKLRSLSKEELEHLENACSIAIGRVVRGFIARRRVKKLQTLRRLEREQLRCITMMQAVARGFLGRRRFNRIKSLYLTKLRGEHSAISIQKVFRGHAAREYFRRLRRWHAAVLIQRVFRGSLGRLAYKREKRRLELLRKKYQAAAKIQSIWRMKVAREEYRSLRIHILAAIEIQRYFRGYLGRKRMARKRLWENTKPGPERIKLGLQFIEESKQAFERQQEEIDALHRAQERAEARISHIHAELKDSEKELVVLERELQEIDQIERDLQVLSHERTLLTQGIEDAAGMPRLAGKGHKDLVMGKESVHDNDPMAERKRRAEAYALEMTIQLKRAEREKKRQELEIEFAAVFQEVEKKRKALQRLELSLSDMEATRERKDREFRRLQKNLMQLLLEQKQELDDLREKGLELETATATTAAAAVATAQKAKEHEKRSNAMFSQTEELMKFQFMSMSLSYFSSLNMLKSLREMNADTTSAAIALSADASATAASAAAAANLPSVKKLHLGANDFVEASIRKKKEELLAAEKAEQELKVMVTNPLPANVRTWTIHDVSRWLDSLSLSQYKEAFLEGSVDGPFLLELREEDLVQVLGIKHKLHVRKILISREKLKPLSQQELRNKEVVEREETADANRDEMGMPSLDTVFSQARNGRVKRVEESLNLGFPIDGEDEKGNTLLLVAAQNSNRRMVEMLLLRGANINHQNAQGNTALHYALAFDPEGTLGEYLIEHGADDTIENIDNLTPYDG
eukprot:scaffold2312_cov165-Ochromonas_danica.AAC.1